MPIKSDKDPKKEGLEKAGELLKLTLALSTGALVFGVGLVKEQSGLTAPAKWIILVAWTLLGLAAGSGILAISAIPMMMAKGNYDLEDKFLTWPARVHQVTFFVGIILLGVALATALLHPQRGEATEKYIINSHDCSGCGALGAGPAAAPPGHPTGVWGRPSDGSGAPRAEPLPSAPRPAGRQGRRDP